MATHNLTEKNGIIRVEFAPNRLLKLKNLSRYVSTKQVAYDMEEIFRNECNTYIPNDAGNLREHGYKVTLSNSKIKPWYKLTYRNTRAVPYTMYQYIGKIRKPNVPIFEREIEKFNPNPYSWKLRPARFKYHHVGWFTPKNATTRQTELNFRRKPVNLPLKAAKGVRKVVHLTGYHNKKSQPKWVEYTQRHGNWWQNETKIYVESVYSSVIEQIANDERKKAQRNASRKNARGQSRAKKSIAKILGYTPGKVKTRLRKRNLGG